ncbi:MAG: preprotein translocase subunit SecG [Candidatus Kerfeldbacteria bacterium]|nr:preprotein translocase subunit SecG [Candidatus Kerfeldbacteria bacterium]
MDFPRILAISQIVLAALLTTAILLQSKGTGLGGAFGGGEGNIYRTKRGAEKVLFIGTIVIAIVFCGTALASFLIKR